MSILAKGGVTALGNAWDVTMDCSGLYFPRVKLQPQVMPGMLPWTVVVFTSQG